MTPLLSAERRGFVSRIRWTLMPWWPFAWRYYDDMPRPSRWWQRCLGSTAWWLDKLLERLPGGALFDPLPPIVCNCEDCRRDYGEYDPAGITGLLISEAGNGHT